MFRLSTLVFSLFFVLISKALAQVEIGGYIKTDNCYDYRWKIFHSCGI